MPSFAEAYDAVRNAYQQYLGRAPESSRVIDEWLGGDYSPESVSRAVSGVQSSPEAEQYRASQTTAPPSSSTNPPNSTLPVGGPQPTPAPVGTTPQTFQGFRPNHAMEGFDFNREQNTGRSAKDAFAYLANQAPPPPLNDKAALAAWFNQYIRPGMDALGHRVTEVNGDTFRFSNWQGDFTVDYGRGAGAEGGALAWQVDPGTAVQPDNPTYTPQAPQTQPQTRTPVPNEPAPLSLPSPTAPEPPPDVPMASLALPSGPEMAPRRSGDVSMAAMAGQPQQGAPPPVSEADAIAMSELARARAQRTRNLQWRV